MRPVTECAIEEDSTAIFAPRNIWFERTLKRASDLHHQTVAKKSPTIGQPPNCGFETTVHRYRFLRTPFEINMYGLPASRPGELVPDRTDSGQISTHGRLLVLILVSCLDLAEN